MTGPVTLLALLLTCVVGSWGLPPRLVSQEEIQALEERLSREIGELRVRSCPRPILRGTPLPGTAAQDMVLVTEGGAGLAECYRFLDEFGSVLFTAPEAEQERGTGLVNRFSEVCRLLPDAIARAVRHGDACSPYRPGVRALPDLRNMLRAFEAARQLAALAVLDGRPGEAADRFLDLARFLQDLVRGGAPMVLAMLSTSMSREVLVSDMGQLLARPDLGTGEVERIGREVGRLMASEPSLARIVAADTTWLAYEAGLPLLRGPGWEPPAGFSAGHRMSLSDYEPDLLPWVAATGEKGVIFAALMDLDGRRREACPVRAAATECIEGLRALRATRSSAARPAWMEVLRILGAASPRRVLRTYYIKRVQQVIEIPLENYIKMHAARHQALTEARRLVRESLEHRAAESGQGSPDRSPDRARD